MTMTEIEAMLAEEFGYLLSKKLIVAEKNKATKNLVQSRDGAKARRNDFYAKLLKTREVGILDHLVAADGELFELDEGLKEARKPFNEKAAPYNRGMRLLRTREREALEDKMGSQLKPRSRISSRVKSWIEKEESAKVENNAPKSYLCSKCNHRHNIDSKIGKEHIEFR